MILERVARHFSTYFDRPVNFVNDRDTEISFSLTEEKEGKKLVESFLNIRKIEARSSKLSQSLALEFET